MNINKNRLLISIILVSFVTMSFFSPVLAATKTWGFTSAGDYNFDSTLVTIASEQAQLKATTSPAWYNSTWKYRKKITIEGDQVSGTVTNFPVLIKLNSSNFDFTKTQSNGYDIRFTTDDGTTLLSFDRERHDVANQLAEYWVKIPSLTNGTDTNIYIYYTPDASADSVLYHYRSGTRYEAFLDQVNVDSSTGVTFGVNKPTKYAGNPLFEPVGANTATWDYDKNFNSVLKIGDQFKMWYFAVSNDGTVLLHAAFASSTDGLTWEKPNLGLVSYGGNTNNNILLGEKSCNPAVVYDPDASADKRYVAVFERKPGATQGGVHLYKSPDGIVWTFIKSLTTTGYAEGKELVKRSDGRWVAYYTQGHASDLRVEAASVSDTTDFEGTWTEQGTIINSTLSTAQKYSMGVDFDGELYYGAVLDYNSTTEEMDVDLYVSRDSLSWTLVDNSWVPLGSSGSWDDGMVLNGKSLIQMGNEWWFYYSGAAGVHSDPSPRDARIGLAKAGYRRIGQISGIGTLTTTAFTPTAGLYVNANDVSNGLQVEVLDAGTGLPISGYASTTFDGIGSNTYETEATWGGQSLPTGSSVKIKFYLNGEAITDAADPATVWNGFSAVEHMSDTTTSAISDSTSNNIDGTKVSAGSPAEATGVIGKAQNFNGTNSFIGFGDVLDTVFSGADKKFSFSMWLKPNVNNATTSNIFGKTADSGCSANQRQFLFGYLTDSKIRFNYNPTLTSGNSRSILGSTPITDTSKWYHILVNYDGSLDTNDGIDRVNIYVDGVAESKTLTSTGTLGDIQNGTGHTFLGKALSPTGTACGTTNPYSYYNGLMDEFRIYPDVTTTGWNTTSYNNQNSPATFYTVGSEETEYSSVSPSISPLITDYPTFGSLSSFSEISTLNGGTIKYQLSNDAGTTWYWYNSGWTTTSSGYAESNTASVINSNIATLPVGSGQLLIKAYLNSNGTQLVQLDSVAVTYTDPEPDPTPTPTPTPEPTATPTPTPSAPTTSSGSSAQGRYNNLISMGLTNEANKIANQYSISSSCPPNTTCTPTTNTTSQFTRDLYQGVVDNDVLNLQKFLNSNGFKIAETGPGSPGNETNFFGQKTKNAVIAYQMSKGISPTGYAGPITRNTLNGLVTATVKQIQVTNTNASTQLFTRALYLGIQGDDVKKLQEILIKEGLLEPGSNTGYFGNLTKQAVKQFQIKYKLVDSESDPGVGYVGPKTRAVFQDVVGRI